MKDSTMLNAFKEAYEKAEMSWLVYRIIDIYWNVRRGYPPCPNRVWEVFEIPGDEIPF